MAIVGWLPSEGTMTWNLHNVFKCDRGVVQLVYNRKSF